MRIAFNTSPLQTGNFLQHRVRGTGFYVKHLQSALLHYFPEHEYIFFTDEKELPPAIDLVHYPYFDPFFITLPLIQKYKTVITVLDLTPIVFPTHFPAGIKGQLRWQLQKMLAKRTDAIITLSDCSTRDVIKYIGMNEKKVHTVYLAPGEEFRIIRDTKKLKNIKKKYSLPEKFVLYVGDVTWNKNLPRLIHAIQKIKIPLVMAGKALVSEQFDKNNLWNKDLIQVQRLVKDDPNIFRLGFVPDDDLVALYNCATVMVMPSLYEGFGFPIVEAMRCGIPVLTTKEGSLEEVAGDSAYYVDAYDENNIAEGLQKVFSDKKLREELSKKGLEHVKKFSWQETARKTVEAYKSVAYVVLD